jgi:hypothetical protein
VIGPLSDPAAFGGWYTSRDLVPLRRVASRTASGAPRPPGDPAADVAAAKRRARVVHELDGDLRAAAAAYAEAAGGATNVAERDHLVRRAGRARAGRALGRSSH